MALDAPKMKPIWFFVGLILLTMGLVIFVSGLYSLWIRPLGPPKVLARLHPDIWWGGLMALAGTAFIFIGRKSPAE